MKIKEKTKCPACKKEDLYRAELSTSIHSSAEIVYQHMFSLIRPCRVPFSHAAMADFMFLFAMVGSTSFREEAIEQGGEQLREQARKELRRRKSP